MAILIYAPLVLTFSVLVVNGDIYRELTEFDAGGTLKYGVLDIQNRSDWLPAVQVESDVPRFKQFFLRLDYLNDLVSFLLNYTALSMGGNVIPYFANIVELENPENLRLLREGTKEDRDKRLNFFSSTQMFPLVINANLFSNDSSAGTVVRELNQLGVPLGLLVIDIGSTSYLTITKQYIPLTNNGIPIKAIIFFTTLSESARIYDYADFMVYMNHAFQKINQSISLIPKNNNNGSVDLTICVNLKEKVRSFEHLSLLTKFLYRWGEEAKCKVMEFWGFYIESASTLISHKNLLFKAFSPQDTPLIGTITYDQFGLLEEICSKPEEFKKLVEIVIDYTEVTEVTKVIKSVEELQCGTRISLQYKYYNGKRSELPSIEDVLNAIAKGIEKHPASIGGITLSVCRENCVCWPEGQDLVWPLGVVRELQRQNLTMAIKSCSKWLITYAHRLKLLGIQRFIYKPVYQYARGPEGNVHIDVTESLPSDAGVIRSLYTSWTDNKDIFMDTFSNYNLLPKKDYCRSLKSFSNKFFNIATIHGLGVAVPLTRLFRFEVVSPSMTNISDYEIKHGLSIKNIAKCSALPPYENDAFEFDNPSSGVTFQYDPNRFSTLSAENLAALLKFINQKFRKIELVIPEAIFDEVNTESMRKLLKSLHHFRTNTFYTTNINKCKFYFNFGNRSVSPDDVEFLKKEFSSVVTGIHVNFNSSAKNIAETKNTLYLLQQISKSVGIVVEYGDTTQFVQNGMGSDLIPSCNYVIIHVNIPKIISLHNRVTPIQVVQDFIVGELNSDVFYEIFLNLYNWKFFFKTQHPNVTLYARIAWPTTSHALSTYAFLRVWKFVQLFSTKYEFQVFVYQAFDEEAGSDLKYGWWKVEKNSSDATDFGNYIEKLSGNC